MQVEERREPQKTNGQLEAAQPAPQKPSAPKPFLILGILAAVVTASIVGYSFLTAGAENTDDAQVSADMVPIGTRVAGQVTRVLIQENQVVKKGDLVAQIDEADYAAK